MIQVGNHLLPPGINSIGQKDIGVRLSLVHPFMVQFAGDDKKVIEKSEITGAYIGLAYTYYANDQDDKSLEIIEINGASAESIHIWDKRASFIDAIKTLMWQYTSLFKIGAHQRRRQRPPRRPRRRPSP